MLKLSHGEDILGIVGLLAQMLTAAATIQDGLINMSVKQAEQTGNAILPE